ncbi:50S ribosomal protein L15e [Candidatus Woesearchaeota archaeon]|nr:50S ribosomal protein L15e [Candidatus Woesearchaeota archaeon]
MSFTHHLTQWFQGRSPAFVHLERERQVTWRRESSIHRLDRPSNLIRARRLGYKAKEGIFVVRVRLKRGGKQRPMIVKGRRSRNFGQTFVMGKNFQWIAEERANKTYPNCEVLNSYYLSQDGFYNWFEVILVDPHHPAIKADSHYNFLSSGKNRGRVYRGLTSAGKKSRGLMYKGKGSEKHRPSLNAHKDLGK